MEKAGHVMDQLVDYRFSAAQTVGGVKHGHKISKDSVVPGKGYARSAIKDSQFSINLIFVKHNLTGLTDRLGITLLR